MAIYHFHARVIKKSENQSAVAAAAYISGAKIFNKELNKFCDYSKKPGVIHSEILAPENAPEWMFDREILWNTVEAIENRKTSQLARSIEVSLPKELSVGEHKKILRYFLEENFVCAGLVADYSIHNDNPGNPHAHILLTMRGVENSDFRKNKIKEREFNSKSKLVDWRKSWADKVNEVMKQSGVSERIDHRSYKEMGVEKRPTKHLGQKAAHMVARGAPSLRAQYNEAIKKFNEEVNGNADCSSRIEKMDNIKDTLKKDGEIKDLSVSPRSRGI